MDYIKEYSSLLISNGLATQDEIDGYTASLTERLVKVLRLSIDDETIPRVVDGYIDSVISSSEEVEAFNDTTPEVDLRDNPRMKALAKKVCTSVDENGRPISKMRTYWLRDGLFEAMLHRLETDPTMAVWGEENCDWGGALTVYRGLTKVPPYHRLFNSFIAGVSIAGAGVRYVMVGGRVIVELVYCDFLGRFGDEVFNQIAK